MSFSRLAIISTHPIQYNAPLFRLLAQEQGIELKVFYTWSQRQHDFYDRTFGEEIKWDIPLMDGYEYEFVENISKDPGSHHYKGIINPQLIDKITKWYPTHLLIYGWKFHSHYRILKHFKGKVPIIFRGDSTLLDYDFKSLSDIIHPSFTFHLSPFISYVKYKLRRLLLTYIYKHIDYALYVGLENKKYYLANGLKERQLIFAPHAIDNERFFDNEKRKYEARAAQWRSELGYKEDDTIILFAGKLEQKKNPELLLKAVQIHNRQTNKTSKQQNNKTTKLSLLKLLFVGNGPLEGLLKQLANDDPNIKFLPFQNQSLMPFVYRLCNVFCLPSQGPNETWGLAVNEALTCKRFILVSDKVGCGHNFKIYKNVVYQFKSGMINNLLYELYKILQKIDNKTAVDNKSFINTWNINFTAKAITSLVKRKLI